MNSSDIAISVKNVSKTFKIPHEKVSSIRGAFTVGIKKILSRRDALPCVSPQFENKDALPCASPSAENKDALPCVSTKQSQNASYEEFNALDNVSFEVKKGEFFGIIGRNGSGKSTLLKILANIYQPDKGSVKINGMISPFLELGIGFNPELSGRDNVYLNATVLGMTKKQIDEKFDSIVAFSELERFIDQKLKNYSSGMQVRLAFSVSIHANRDILLMDEVLAVGDSNFQSKCLEEFNKYRDAGRTVIIVTHDISVVQRYCDRAMLLRNGKVKKIGKAEEVANEYIHENMGDEESRLTHDQRRTTNDDGSVIAHESASDGSEATPKPQKIAEITRVEFLDKDGNKKNVFQTGDDMSVRVYFKVGKKIDALNFGMTIVNQDGTRIIGVSTVLDKISVKKYLLQGYFEVHYKNIPLRENAYSIDAAIFGLEHSKVYEYQCKIKTFKVFSRNQNDGIIEINYEWK